MNAKKVAASNCSVPRKKKSCTGKKQKLEHKALSFIGIENPEDFVEDELYKAMGVIKTGQFGIVYKVRSKKDDNFYALKHIYKYEGATHTSGETKNYPEEKQSSHQQAPEVRGRQSYASNKVVLKTTSQFSMGSGKKTVASKISEEKLTRSSSNHSLSSLGRLAEGSIGAVSTKSKEKLSRGTSRNSQKLKKDVKISRSVHKDEYMMSFIPSKDDIDVSSSKDPSTAYPATSVKSHTKSEGNSRKSRESKSYCKEDLIVRSLREFKILRHLGNKNKFIVKHFEVYDCTINNHVYPHLLFELCNCDLAHLMEMPNLHISVEQHRWLTFQILSGVEYLHRNRVLHRDLQPENVLLKFVDKTVELKLTDFGSAVSFAGMTSWITESPTYSKLYTPPEVHLGATRYKVNSDLWCAGLLIAEIKCRNHILDIYDIDASIGQLCGPIKQRSGVKDFYMNKTKLEEHNKHARQRHLRDKVMHVINDDCCIGEILAETLCAPGDRMTANALLRTFGHRLRRPGLNVMKKFAHDLVLNFIELVEG